MSGPARQASCPSCGGPIEFKLGSSAAVVCPWCRHSVLRTDRDLQTLGKIADLVPTAPDMAVGDYGTVDLGEGEPQEFVVGGRLQLDHGRGPWDEWYVELPRQGRWAWIAKAQGFWYVTFPVEGAQPPGWDRMEPGSQGVIPGAGEQTWTVAERGGSALQSAEGELPFPAAPGESGRYVDLSGPEGAFATIDYGDGSDPPRMFIGRQLPPEAIQWKEGAVGPRPTDTVDAGKLQCPTCGSPVPIQVPDRTERAACPSCYSLLDYSQGALHHLKRLAQERVEPMIPLGSRGELAGLDCLVIGFMERCTVVDYVTYAWREYLLHTPQGYRWLLEDSGHFTFIEPVTAGEVELAGNGAVYDGQQYKAFSRNTLASVRFVIGEFYWQVEVGEQTQLSDFIAPPHILSEERNPREVIWSHGEYVDGKRVWEAFALPGSPPKPYDVAPAQPNPVGLKLPVAFSALTVLILGVLALALQDRPPDVTLVQGPVPMPASPDPEILQKAASRGLAGTRGLARTPSPDGHVRNVTYTDTFQIPEGVSAVEMKLSSDLGQGWLGVAAALIHEETGEIVEFSVEQDAFRASGSATRSSARVTEATVGPVEPGPHVLRLDPHWARRPGAIGADTPPEATVTLAPASATEGGGCCCFCSGGLLLLPALLSFVRRSTFEQRRWRNSNL